MAKHDYVIGIDQSYNRTGITVLDNKRIIIMKSVNYEGCKNNTDKRKYITNTLFEIMDMLDSYGINNPHYITVICERIRLKSQGFINENYLKSTGALVATIIDFFYEYDIPVYSVDTRSWKSQIVGNSKPLNNSYGIDSEKYRTILYLKSKGLLKYIVEEYKGRGKKGVINVKMKGKRVPCKINDDLADSYCIAMYGFLPESKQKLREERF